MRHLYFGDGSIRVTLTNATYSRYRLKEKRAQERIREQEEAARIREGHIRLLASLEAQMEASQTPEERQEAFSLYSDVYKDTYGIRPRWLYGES